MYSSLMLGLAVAIAAPGIKEPPKKDAPSLAGEWIPTKVILGGKPDNQLSGSSIIFKADGTLITKEAKRAKAEQGSYSIGAKKSPAQIDIIPSIKGKVQNVVGIYRFEKDTLIICIALRGDRPTKFESPAGSMINLLTLKRAKKN